MLVGSTCAPAQEEWELCISMLVEKEKELPAELGTSGAAFRRRVVIARSRDC